MYRAPIAYSDKIGGKTINDFILSDKWSMEANEAWIKQIITEGRKIIDTGPDFARRAKRAEQGCSNLQFRTYRC
jgi:hypothetical protein